MKIYLARPFTGYTYEEIMEYYEVLTKTLVNWGYEVLVPPVEDRDDKNHCYFGDAYVHHVIVARDKWMVQEADIVFVDFLSFDRVSIGACMELGWGHLLGKHTIAANIDGAHKHAFITECADVIFESTEAAVDYFIRLEHAKRGHLR